MKWSLNNTKLIVETFDDLLVLDVDKGKIYDICFSDTRLNRAWQTQSIFYPEDGRYIITSLYLMDEKFNAEYFDVLIDLTNMRTYKLDTPKYKERIDWLTLP